MNQTVPQILDQYGNPFNKSVFEDPNVSIDDLSAWEEELNGGSNTDAGVVVSTRVALGQPALWRALNLIANDVGKIPLYVKESDDLDGDARDKTHPAYKLLRRKPNSLMTIGTFKRTISFHALWYGNGLAYIERNLRQDPVSLSILNPEETTPVIENGDLWYVTTVRGEFVRLRPENVLHIKGLSHDGISGINVCDIMKDALSLGVAARQFGAKFYKNGSNGSGVLMIPGSYKEEKARNVIKAWSKMVTGMAKAHKVAVIQDGVKYQQLSISPEQGQFLETRQFEAKEIALIIGVPPHKIGDDSKVSYNSLEQENKAYLEQSLDPWFCSWEEECEDKLLTEDQKNNDSHYVEFDRDALLSTDKKTQSEKDRIDKEMGVMTTNQILKRRGQPTIGPPGDKYYVPSNWVEVGSNENKTDDSKKDPDASVTNSLRELIRDRAALMLQSETSAILKASSREKNFLEWLDSFYQNHSQRMESALKPVVNTVCAVLQCDPKNVSEFCNNWAEESKSLLTEASGVPVDQFESNINDVVSGWEHRIDTVITCFMGEIEND